MTRKSGCRVIKTTREPAGIPLKKDDHTSTPTIDVNNTKTEPKAGAGARAYQEEV